MNNNNTDLHKLYKYLTELKEATIKEKEGIKELQQKQNEYTEKPEKLLKDIKLHQFELRQEYNNNNNILEKKPQLERKNDYVYFLRENHLLQHYGGEELFN